MTTLETYIGLTPPSGPGPRGPLTCANGHLWTAETTRWRYRMRLDRAEKSWTGWERDCLTCKREQYRSGR